MSDLARRPSNRPSRKQREQRAYRLVVAGGTAGAVAVVGLALSILGIVGSGVWLIAAIVAAVCAVAFKRTVS
jgi:type IV secretory pathway TrbD component